MNTDHLIADLTRRFAEQLRAAAPALPQDVLDDLAERHRAALYAVAEAAADDERRRLRPGGWS